MSEMSTHQRWEYLTTEPSTFLKFQDVKAKKSKRADLHAFLFLDELFPGDRCIVSGASHDQIWLSITENEVDSLTDAQIVELSQCGVFHDEDGYLSMFP